MLLGQPVMSLALMVLAASIGFLGHVLWKVGEIRERSDSSMTLIRYLAQKPYKTGAKVIAVLVAAVTLTQPEVTLTLFLSAIGLGYSADSAINHIQR